MRVESMRVAAAIALNAALLMASPALVGAQQRPAGCDPVEHVAWLAQELSLDQAQTERAQEIFEAHFQAMEGIHASHQQGNRGPHHAQHGQPHAERGQHRDQVAALWRGTNERLAEILTDEQRAQYDEPQAKPGHHRGMGSAGSARPSEGGWSDGCRCMGPPLRG